MNINHRFRMMQNVVRGIVVLLCLLLTAGCGTEKGDSMNGSSPAESESLPLQNETAETDKEALESFGEVLSEKEPEPSQKQSSSGILGEKTEGTEESSLRNDTGLDLISLAVSEEGELRQLIPEGELFEKGETRSLWLDPEETAEDREYELVLLDADGVEYRIEQVRLADIKEGFLYIEGGCAYLTYVSRATGDIVSTQEADLEEQQLEEHDGEAVPDAATIPETAEDIPVAINGVPAATAVPAAPKQTVSPVTPVTAAPVTPAADPVETPAAATPEQEIQPAEPEVLPDPVVEPEILPDPAVPAPAVTQNNVPAATSQNGEADTGQD